MNNPDYKPPRAIDNVTQDAYNYTFLTELSYEKWLLTAKNLYKNAQQKQRSGLNPEAYVSYLRFIDLMVNKIPLHPDFKDRSSYRTLKNIALNLSEIVDNLKIAVIKEREDYITQRKQERLKKRQKELLVILEVEKPLESDSMLQNSINEYKEAITETSNKLHEQKERNYVNESSEGNTVVTEVKEPLKNSPESTLKKKENKDNYKSSSILQQVESDNKSFTQKKDIDNYPFEDRTLQQEEEITKDKAATNLIHSLSNATSAGSLLKDINDNYSIGNRSDAEDKLGPSVNDRLTLDPRSFKINNVSCQPTIFKNYSKNRNMLNSTENTNNNSKDNEITVNPFSELGEESTGFDETLPVSIAYQSDGKTTHTQSTNIEDSDYMRINKTTENSFGEEEKSAQTRKIYTLSDITDVESPLAYGIQSDDNRNAHSNVPNRTEALNNLLNNPYKGMDFNIGSKYKINSVSFINTPINDRGFRTRSFEPISPLKVNNADKMNLFIFDDYDNQTIDKDMDIMSIPIYPNEMKGFPKLEINKLPSNNLLPDIESDVEQVFDKNNEDSSSDDINEEYLENNIITEDEHSVNSKTQHQLVKTPHMYNSDDIKFSNSPISILSPLKPPKLKSTDEIEEPKDFEKDLQDPIPMENFEKLILTYDNCLGSKAKLELSFSNIDHSKNGCVSSNETPSQQKMEVIESTDMKNSLLSPIATNRSALSIHSSSKSLAIPTKPTITNFDNGSVVKSLSSKADYLFCDSFQKVFFPKRVKHKFMDFVKRNTFANLETSGLLCGKLSETNSITITDILIPDQKISSNCCKIINEHAIIKYIDNNNLYIIGWIHTHPRQACFLSSIDLHTQFVYQQLLPEAIAVVIAPESSPSMGIFRLTKDTGMTTIQNCKESGFHKHSIKTNESLYVDCLKDTEQNVIVSSSFPVSMTDLREYEYIIKGPKK